MSNDQARERKRDILKRPLRWLDGFRRSASPRSTRPSSPEGPEESIQDDHALPSQELHPNQEQERLAETLRLDGLPQIHIYQRSMVVVPPELVTPSNPHAQEVPSPKPNRALDATTFPLGGGAGNDDPPLLQESGVDRTRNCLRPSTIARTTTSGLQAMYFPV
ncbi:hypothetical protein BKA70DRAFT_1232482 [Coprinopsis sp. MPI-PUGE-AT-0042]|nr:hypothetical protein BKA70DRAFT_1232482 [Coprinopsis sp. MPI-PUGE-AT-0042]